jgi:transcriptional antiterminator NusG
MLKQFNWYTVKFFSKTVQLTLRRLYFFIKRKGLEPFFSKQALDQKVNGMCLKAGLFFLKVDFKSMGLVKYNFLVSFLDKIGLKLQLSLQNHNPLPLNLNETTTFINDSTTKSRKKAKVVLEVGSFIIISKGPFSNLKAHILKINRIRRRVEVNVSIFGRLTPVELEYNQIKNIN